MTGEKDAEGGLRDCARVVFEHIGLSEPPASYFDDLEALDRAARAWFAERGPRLGPCCFNAPDLVRGWPLVTGNLDAADAAGWLGNEAARDFVRYVDQHTARRGTLLMLQVLLTIRLALQPSTNAPGGSA